MSNISKINIDGTEYDIQDELAVEKKDQKFNNPIGDYQHLGDTTGIIVGAKLGEPTLKTIDIKWNGYQSGPFLCSTKPNTSNDYEGFEAYFISNIIPDINELKNASMEIVVDSDDSVEPIIIDNLYEECYDWYVVTYYDDTNNKDVKFLIITINLDDFINDELEYPYIGMVVSYNWFNCEYGDYCPPGIYFSVPLEKDWTDFPIPYYYISKLTYNHLEEDLLRIPYENLTPAGIASSTELGEIRVGNNLSIDESVLSYNASRLVGTYLADCEAYNNFSDGWRDWIGLGGYLFEVYYSGSYYSQLKVDYKNYRFYLGCSPYNSCPILLLNPSYFGYPLGNEVTLKVYDGSTVLINEDVYIDSYFENYMDIGCYGRIQSIYYEELAELLVPGNNYRIEIEFNDIVPTIDTGDLNIVPSITNGSITESTLVDVFSTVKDENIDYNIKAYIESLDESAAILDKFYANSIENINIVYV